jgi:hypothetical protein
MPRRLVLHIGHYKTGSTVLQAALTDLRDFLGEQGVLYPEAGAPSRVHPSHSGLAFQELERAGSHLPDWYLKSEAFTEYTSGQAPSAREAIASEIAIHPAEMVIISSEEFIRFGSSQGAPAAQVKAMIRELGFEHVTVICYVRRPDHYLGSWYNQLIRMGAPVERLSVSLGLGPHPEHQYYGTEHTDFDRMIGYWADDVGCHELIVRDYDHLRSGSIYDDFSAAVGLPAIGAAEIDDVGVSSRIDNNFIEYARVWSLFRPGEDQGALHDLLSEMEEHADLPHRFDVYLLDPEACRRLHEYSTHVNRRLGTLAGNDTGFFADLDEMLVIPERAKSDVEAFRFWAPYIDAGVDARRIG